MLQLCVLCVRVYARGHDHLHQLVVVGHARVHLLLQLWVEAEKGDLLHHAAGATALSQRLRLANLMGGGCVGKFDNNNNSNSNSCCRVQYVFCVKCVLFDHAPCTSHLEQNHFN